MGFWRSVFRGDNPVEWADPTFGTHEGPAFAVDADSIDPAVFGLTSYASPTSPAPRIDRRSAMQVPAVKRSRDLIAGVLGGLPLDLLAPDKQATSSPLFEQPERNVPRSVTMARLFEDLLFEQVGWWRVLERDWRGYPTKVVRLEPRTVSVKQDGKVYVTRAGHNGSVDEWVQDAELIRFDSPNDGLLIAGARAIRTALALDSAATNYASELPPLSFFTPSEGADPADDDDIVELLDAWKTARQKRSTAYVPASLKFQTVTGFSPEQLQLADARQHAVLEIARIAGVDPEELGVSTTSRTYANAQDRRKAFLDFTLGSLRQAVEDRLSMGDITPRGYYAKFNLSSFLRSDDKTRFETYAIGLEVGAVTKDEIRALEDKPPALPADPTTEQEPALSAEPVATFDAKAPDFRLDAEGAVTFEVDIEKRTITGLAVPYGVPGKSLGQRWQFSQGVFKYGDVSRVKLWVQHDPNRAVGKAVELEDRPEGLFAKFKVVNTAAGDEALLMADEGVWDGLSVGFSDMPKTKQVNGINHVLEAPLMEVSLTPAPSFDDARVHAVAASATEGNTMDETTTNEAAETEAVTPDFSAAITDALKAGFESLAAEHAKDKPVVIAAGAPLFSVEEAPAYRFDGTGERDFSTDLIAGLKNGDGEAKERVVKFMHDAFLPAFNVTVANAAEANPTVNRPDMYVDARRFSTPFYSALYKGTLSDITPFVFPKLNSYSDLVTDHVEGTEPTAGAFDLTGQTVTPTAVSGKVVINREVWDQGGNPQVSRLIWSKMQYEYFRLLEAKAVAVLNAASPTGITLTAGAEDDALVNELEAAIADLNFVAGGNVFNFAGTQIDLYKKLAAAVDSTGRKLLPIINPTNANGRATAGLKSLDVAGTTFTPANSLAATGSVAASSYLVDTESVHVWNSAPREITMDAIKVATVELGIWGYVAAAISDLTGVREVIYDPVA